MTLWGKGLVVVFLYSVIVIVSSMLVWRFGDKEKIDKVLIIVCAALLLIGGVICFIEDYC